MATSTAMFIREIAQIRNEMKNLVRCGTVHEIKGDKMRIYWGNDKDGKPQYSPFIHNSTVRGEATRRMAYSDEKGEQGGGQDSGSGGGSGGGGGGAGGGGAGGGAGGGGGKQNGGQQNITVICPGGDYRQAIVLPYGPQAKGSHKPPSHANKSGKGEEPWQMGNNRYNRCADSYDQWYEEDQKGGQQGGGGQGGGDEYQGGDKGTSRVFHNEKKGAGGQHMAGKAQYMANEKGAGLMQDKQFLTISKQDKQIIAYSIEPPIINKPWEIKEKKNPHEMYTSEGSGKKKKSGGQSGGSGTA